MNALEKAACVLLAVWFLETVLHVLDLRREAAADEANRGT